MEQEQPVSAMLKWALSHDWSEGVVIDLTKSDGYHFLSYPIPTSKSDFEKYPLEYKRTDWKYQLINWNGKNIQVPLELLSLIYNRHIQVTKSNATYYV